MNILFPYMARWKAVNWTRYHQIFTQLAGRGHTVYVLQPPSSTINETNFQEIEVDIPSGIELIDVPLSRWFWRMHLPLNKLVKKGYYCFASVNMLRRMLRERDIDALFLYNIPQYPLMEAADCLRIFDIADDYRAMLRQELGTFSHPVLLRQGERMLETMLRKSDVTLAVSHVLASQFSDGAGHPVSVVPNGVDIAEAEAADGTAIRRQYPGPIIGFIGSFEYFIDFDLILQAARRFPEYTFLLVGSGREFTRVSERVAAENLTNVVLPGGVPHHKVFEYIKAMDVCLNIFKPIPISHGACPLKLFEYIACNKPVISTRLDELTHIDRDFLFYADTLDEFSTALRRIFSEPEKTADSVRRSLAAVRQGYGWDTIVAELETLMLQAVSRRRAGGR